MLEHSVRSDGVHRYMWYTVVALVSSGSNGIMPVELQRSAIFGNTPVERFDSMLASGLPQVVLQIPEIGGMWLKGQNSCFWKSQATRNRKQTNVCSNIHNHFHILGVL